MNFAYLIMAHENSVVLRSLLKLIDDERNDIYIHIDKNTLFDFQNELTKQVEKSKLYFTDRIDVRWANISQVEAEYVLFKEAHNTKEYDYYHLLSGADLPIKSQDEIHSFFEKNRGKEFIGFAEVAIPDRLKYIHLLPKMFRNRSKALILIRKLAIILQKLIGFNSLSGSMEMEIKNGTNWVSVTRDFVGHLLENKSIVLSKMKFSKSPDEYYKQILAYNSSYREKLFSLEDEFAGCQRLIDWNRGKPYEWANSDFAEIMASEKLFARKFGKSNVEFIEKLEKSLSTRKC